MNGYVRIAEWERICLNRSSTAWYTLLGSNERKNNNFLCLVANVSKNKSFLCLVTN